MANVVEFAAVVAFLWTQVETKFAQFHPRPDDAATLTRSPDRERAVILIHGLSLHPLHGDRVKEAQFRDWQKTDSTLVQALSVDSDVYAFSYGQNVAVPEIAGALLFEERVPRLREMGYTEIVLVGHSAGGLIARQFVEDHPHAGVTKVIQLCCPNTGSALAKTSRLVRDTQVPFVESLSKTAREEFLNSRQHKKIPELVQFVCVVGDGGAAGDFVVSDQSQWPEDLQKQGIPAIRLVTTHATAVRSSRVAPALAALVREKQPRWDAEKVSAARRSILGK